jgi:hypothetical protein
MNEVVRGADAREGAVERGLVETVAADDFCGRSLRRDSFRPPRYASNGTAGLFEMSKKAAANVSRGTGEQNVGFHMTHLFVFIRKRSAVASLELEALRQDD